MGKNWSELQLWSTHKSIPIGELDWASGREKNQSTGIWERVAVIRIDRFLVPIPRADEQPGRQTSKHTCTTSVHLAYGTLTTSKVVIVAKSAGRPISYSPINAFNWLLEIFLHQLQFAPKANRRKPVETELVPFCSLACLFYQSFASTTAGKRLKTQNWFTFEKLDWTRLVLSHLILSCLD